MNSRSHKIKVCNGLYSYLFASFAKNDNGNRTGVGLGWGGAGLGITLVLFDSKLLKENEGIYGS